MSAFATDERYARLAQLPQWIEFPPELKDRMYYDASGKRLVFRGRMSRTERDKLIRLDEDVLYHQAIFRLYMGNPSRWSWTAIVVTVLLVGGLALAAVHWMKG